MVCPICKKPVKDTGQCSSQWHPFCSERCKLVDLGRWLEGKYQIPVEEPPELPGEGPDSSLSGP